MSNETDLQPNIFDLLSDARWAFVDAMSAIRSISNNLYSRNATTEDEFLRAEVALEKAAVIADKIAVFTTTFPDAYMQPEDMAVTAREAKRFIRTERDWLLVSRKADEIGNKGWRKAIEEWAKREGMGRRRKDFGE